MPCNEPSAATEFNTSRVAIIRIIWPNFRRIKRENVSCSCVVHQQKCSGFDFPGGSSLLASERNSFLRTVRGEEGLGASARIQVLSHWVCILYCIRHYDFSEQKNGICQYSITHL